MQELTQFIWWMQTERQVAANPQTKPIDLGCEFAENWQPPSTSTIAFVIIIQPIIWHSFYRPSEGRRLSWPRHCSKGAQPVPKAVYHSSCRDEHEYSVVVHNHRFTAIIQVNLRQPAPPVRTGGFCSCKALSTHALADGNHRCNIRLQRLPKIFKNAFVIFVNVYYFTKLHVKCRKALSNS